MQSGCCAAEKCGVKQRTSFLLRGALGELVKDVKVALAHLLLDHARLVRVLPSNKHRATVSFRSVPGVTSNMQARTFSSKKLEILPPSGTPPTPNSIWKYLPCTAHRSPLDRTSPAM